MHNLLIGRLVADQMTIRTRIASTTLALQILLVAFTSISHQLTFGLRGYVGLVDMESSVVVAIVKILFRDAAFSFKLTAKPEMHSRSAIQSSCP